MSVNAQQQQQYPSASAIIHDFSSISSKEKESRINNLGLEEEEEEENNDGEVNQIPGLKAPTPSKASS